MQHNPWEIKFHELARQNQQLFDPEAEPFRIKVLANITPLYLEQCLEYALRLQGVPAKVELGNYDNILQDSQSLEGYKAVVVFWEAINLADQLEAKADAMEQELLQELAHQTMAQVAMTLRELARVPLVLFNTFSAWAFEPGFSRSRVSGLCSDLNQFLEAKSVELPNLRLVDLQKVLAHAGLAGSFDWRGYLASKVLYSFHFFKRYAQFVVPPILSLAGKAKKIFVFDCDNTLWKGVLGEDGWDGIRMRHDCAQGRPFAQVQLMAKALVKKGILIGICSKNNPEDVLEVFEKHPDMTLREEDVAIFKVNWNDKAANLRAMARELNIGLDSFVFVDDSDFEVELVRRELPEVTVAQVPKPEHHYPEMARALLDLFYRPWVTPEDHNKTQMYKAEAKRRQVEAQHADLDGFLRSLDIRVSLHDSEYELLPRMAQLTQKTNQFNLTTRRLSETEMEALLESRQHEVFAWHVADKFGDSGFTGLALIDLEGEQPHLSNFLMSCRVIGRGIERAVFDALVERLAQDGHELLTAEFVPSKKNAQVADFLPSLGFERVEALPDKTRYRLRLDQYQAQNIHHIKLEWHGR